MRCIHCGGPARYEFLAYLPSMGLDEVWEPVCDDCRDGYRYVRDTCDCDEGHVCDYHRATNTLPTRED